MPSRNQRRAMQQQAEAEARNVFTQEMGDRLEIFIGGLIGSYSERGACSHCLCLRIFELAAGSILNGGETTIDELKAILDRLHLEASDSAGSA